MISLTQFRLVTAATAFLLLIQHAVALVPHSSWTGDASSGFSDNGGKGVSIPTEQPRTNYKPAAQWANSESRERVDSTLRLEVVAFAKGGIESVTFYCEGNAEKVTTPTLAQDGIFSYAVDIDASSTIKDGNMDVYAEVVPKNQEAQARLLGPFRVVANAHGTLPDTGKILYVDSRYSIPVTGHTAAAFNFREIVDWENQDGTKGSGRIYEGFSGTKLVLSTISGTDPQKGAAFVSESTGVSCTATDSPSYYGSSKNDGSIDAPRRSIRQFLHEQEDWSGVEFRLKAGSYAADIRTDHWKPRSAWKGAIIVTRDPSFEKSDVWLDISAESATAIEPDYVVFRGLSIQQRQIAWNDKNNYPGVFTFDDCSLVGDGLASDYLVVNKGKYSLTNTTIQNWDTLSPMNNAYLARNVKTTGGSGDILSGCPAALGITIEKHIQSPGQHVDLIQIETSYDAENRVLLNVSSIDQKGQGLFFTKSSVGSAIRDVAIVNCIIDTAQGQLNWPVDHFLMYHVTEHSGSMQLVAGVAMEALPIKITNGSFNGGLGIKGSNSSFTASIPKNGYSTTNGIIFIDSRVGTPVTGEQVKSSDGKAVGIVSGPPTFIAKTNNNEIVNCYFYNLSTKGPGMDEHIEREWNFHQNAIDSNSGWAIFGDNTRVSNPFTSGLNPSQKMKRFPALSQVPFDINGQTRNGNVFAGAIEVLMIPTDPDSLLTK